MNDCVGCKSLEVMSEAQWYNHLIFNRFVKPHVGQRVLEIGSGIGNFTKLLLKKSRFLYATDINDDYISLLKRIKNKKLRVGFGNIESNVFKPNYNNFDSIICLNVLEHIKNDKKALGNIYNRLKTNGKLILLVPAHQQFYCQIDKNLGHFRRYNKKSLRKKIINLGFNIVSEDYLNPISGLGWFVSGKILRKKMVSRDLIKIFNFLVKPIIKIETMIKMPFGLSVVIVAVKK